ncbi:peptide ABC transporter ATP-binding protein [Fructilactobacillus lindneri]|uniref:Oligopeptide ABC transporter, ATP-binding subunit n=2 Tax=Fructilactobacillus lindneri TaxID=53444 RepID=A0A0R2JYN7_9LACO|nr:ABC transporter ATP-binding protein [Fructilactobacillus lindneri]ANZ57434.1 peptide ABC transporter ATP-binding protein [Fructilactobacillus lindneri]ANZ58701.1 peptide ABC transporter ATP-binding protein [Fructilactobacillus lindneri]KRN80044.1 oligopeptide ABC transporter, ATP-binding subunit [Fructilactobacillus lindneri DSM 20690 = JCM 11027]POG97919.1 peptide ABC transporter ATP-binding protein [Fructilactobacillus lindneri]POG99251.1 peptide ABC transporter ATP-binding protein [Fruct
MSDKVLEVKDLEVDFSTLNGTVHAIRDVSFDLNKGETLALVGESGSGKSVTVRSVIQLYAKNAKVTNGEITFHGKNLLELSPKEMDKIRGKDISMIFQDPMTSLDPTMTIGKQVAEPLLVHHDTSEKEAMKRAQEVLKLVGIPNAKERMHNYPHQFSGGQRQRIVIAMAIIDNPEILIADEPTTALDVTVQAQIISLLKDLQKKIGTSIIFITHDLGVVAGIADRVAVMYAGKIIEYGTTDEIYYDPKHPYTWGLLDSMPTLGLEGKRLKAIPGTPANLIDPPKGDAFAPRSEYAMKIDERLQPPFFKVTDTHYAATWLLDPKAPKVTPPASIQERYNQYQKLRGENDG